MTRTINIKNKSGSSKRLSSKMRGLSRRSKSSTTSSKTKKNKTFVRKFAKVGLVFVIIALIGMLGGTVYGFSWLQQLNQELPSPDAPFVDPPIASTVYDRKGETQLYKVIGDFNSDPVDIEEIPEHVKWAFLAAEDADFYNHSGFDTAGIIRCSANFLRDGGDNLCGASTVTQQLLKITALADEESKVQRKVKELFMATQVEQKYSKDEILQMYLSVVPFGSNIVGIETAADFYFDKNPRDLTLAEAAILSSIIQNPSRFSPTKPYDGDVKKAQEAVKQRQENHVLFQLELKMDQVNELIKKAAETKAAKDGVDFNPDEVEYITEEIINEAKAEELTYEVPIATDKLAGHFVDFVLNELQRKNFKNGEEPFTISELQNGGYKIYTTLDYELQKEAEAAVKKGGTEYDYWNVHNAAVMTMVPKTGEIITMAGSKSFTGKDEGCDENLANCWYNPEVNVLTSLQSPGSTNKVTAYELAYELGLLYPGSMLPDVQIEIGSYVPKNWNGSISGVDNYAKDMIRKSLNMPALFVVEMIGVENYIKRSQDLGYTTYADDGSLGHSVVLGGTSVYPVEHATAFTAYANQGDVVPYQSILRVEDRQGNVVFEHKPEPRKVVTAQGAYLINQTLLNLEHFQSWDGREVSAKTGTSEENIDSWIVAWSPDFVTLGWVGNNNNDPLNQVYGYPIYVVNPWLTEYMSKIGESEYFSAKTPFERPGFVYRGGGDCDEETGECLGFINDWLIQDKEPQPGRVQQKVDVCKDQPNRLAREIDIATGNSEKRTFTKYVSPAPSWQNFVDDYLRSKNTPNGAPTEFCDVDRSGGAAGPFFNILPANGQTITGNNLTVSGSIFTSSGDVQSARFYLNGQQIGSTLTFVNFSQTFNIAGLGLENGVYTFRAEARDTQGITNFYDVNVIIGSRTTSNFSVSFPSSSVLTGTPQLITANYSGAGSLSGLNLYVVNTGTNQITDLGAMAGGGSTFTKSWTPTTAGSYRFYVIGTLNGGGTVQSEQSSQINVS